MIEKQAAESLKLRNSNRKAEKQAHTHDRKRERESERLSKREILAEVLIKSQLGNVIKCRSISFSFYYFLFNQKKKRWKKNGCDSDRSLCHYANWNASGHFSCCLFRLLSFIFSFIRQSVITLSNITLSIIVAMVCVRLFFYISWTFLFDWNWPMEHITFGSTNTQTQAITIP